MNRPGLTPIPVKEKPQKGDYLKLLKDDEAHTTIDRVWAYRIYEGWWRVTDSQGEEFLCVRWEEGDNQIRKAWREAPKS